MGYLQQLISGSVLRFLFVPRYPKLKITPLVLAPQLPLDGITSGIFPYLGGSVSVDQLRSVMMVYESAIVPGRQGAKLAAKTPGVLIDPAVYVLQARTEPETLFDYDDWLMRQQAAGVPLILTDTPRIRNKDISALRKALARWDAIDEPTLVVLPIEEGDDERDESPSVLVPALNDYVETSKLSVFARIRRMDVLRCDDRVCRGDSLLRIADLSETDLRDGRMLASLHNLASTEQLARRVLAAADPRDAWWETCNAGARSIASLAGSGVSLPLHRWLRQWLELGSPAHEYRPVG